MFPCAVVSINVDSRAAHFIAVGPPFPFPVRADQMIERRGVVGGRWQPKGTHPNRTAQLLRQLPTNSAGVATALLLTTAAASLDTYWEGLPRASDGLGGNGSREHSARVIIIDSVHPFPSVAANDTSTAQHSRANTCSTPLEQQRSDLTRVYRPQPPPPPDGRL